jgi:hypothetical protein
MAYIEVNLSEFEDMDLVDELQDRGFTVINGELGDVKELQELYKDYKTYGFSDDFRRLLEKFFEEM